ncbi:MAG: hypothetical protein AB7N90_15750, partial [Vicinamibacterales bacterium]
MTAWRPRTGVLALVVVAGCSGGGTGVPAPPATAVRPVTDTIQGQAFTDDYRWLEEQESPDVRAWIDAQNANADLILGQTPADPAVRARLLALSDAPDIGRVQKGGDFEYFSLRRRGDGLAAIYRRPAAPDTDVDPAAPYDLVIDPRPMSEDLSTSVDLVAVAPDGSRLIYGVRDGGQDERTLVVRDLATGADTERFPNALYDSVSLAKDGSGFYYVRRSRETGARVRFHPWGAPIEGDEVIFGEGYGPTAFVSMAQSDDGSRFLFTVQHGWASNEVWFQDVAAGTPAAPLVRGLAAHFNARFVDDAVWMRTDYEAPLGRVVAVDPAAPAPEHWRTVVAEQEDALEDYVRIGDRIYGTYIHEASSRILLFDEAGRARGELELPPMVSASLAPEGEGRARLTVQSFTQPSTVYSVDLATRERHVVQPPEVEWDASG